MRRSEFDEAWEIIENRRTDQRRDIEAYARMDDGLTDEWKEALRVTPWWPDWETDYSLSRKDRLAHRQALSMAWTTRQRLSSMRAFACDEAPFLKILVPPYSLDVLHGPEFFPDPHEQSVVLAYTSSHLYVAIRRPEGTVYDTVPIPDEFIVPE